MSDSFPVVKEKRPKSSKEPNRSFVKSVTSRVSGLLPSTITKWFSSQSTSSANGSATLAESTDSSTEDEATEGPIITQPAAKRMRFSSPSKNSHYTTIITKSSSTNTESIEPFNSVQSPPGRNMYRREPNFVSTPLQRNIDESTFSGSEKNVNSFNLHSPSSSNNVSIDRKRKSLFDKTQDFQSTFENIVARSPSTRAIDLTQPYFKAGLLCSPFYSGRTTYGGAAGSYMNQPNIKHRKTTLVSREANNNDHVISHSARRVMDILENYSSPLIEAKRIPQYIGSQNSSLSLDNTDSNRKNSSYKTQELHVPKIASIIRLKQKSRLMNSTNAARQIIASHSSSAEYSPYPISAPSQIQKVPEKDKLTTKIKPRLTRTNRDGQESSVASEPINLPTISLNIDKDNLPKFSFNMTSVPSSTSFTATNITTTTEININKITKPKDNTVNIFTTNEKVVQPADQNKKKSEQNSIPQFKFSSPVKVSVDPSTSSTSTFSFVSPDKNLDMVNKQIGVIVSTSGSQKKKDVTSNTWMKSKLSTDTDTVNMTNDTAIKCSCNSSEVQNKNSKCDLCEKKTSNIEKLPVEKETVSEKWKCTDCWVQNDNSADKCVCCGGKKPVKTTATTTSTPTKSDKWQCNDCWVQNDSNASKCVCCGGAKPSKSSINKEQFNHCVTTSKETPNASDWKCDDCWIKNKNTSDKCVACGGAKPGSKKVETNSTNNQLTSNTTVAANLPLQDIVKSQTDMWECSICLVRNKNNRNTCICCEMERPGSKKESESKFSFKDNPGAVFKFGIQPKEPTSAINIEVKSTTAENQSKESEANNNEVPKASTFTFGIPKINQESEKNTLDGKKEPPKVNFTFGINKQIPTSTSTEIPKSLFSLQPKKPEEIETNTKSDTEKPVDIPKVESAAPTFTSMPKISAVNSLFAAPITTESLTKTLTPSSTLTTQNESVNTVSKESSISALSSASLTILPTTSLTNAETKVPASTFTFSAGTIKPSVNLFATPASQVSIASPTFANLQPTAVTSSISLFNKSEPVNTAAMTLFPKSESTPVSLPVFGNNNSTTTTVASEPTTTSAAPVFRFSNLGECTAPQTEKPKFNFTFGSANNNETSSMFKTTFGTTGDNKFTLPAANTLGTSNALTGNTLGGNGLSTGNNSASNILPGTNGLPSGNTLLGSDLGSNQLNTGNALLTSGPVSSAPSTGLFGNPMQKVGMWPANNAATSNTPPQFDKLNTLSYDKPATFTFGSSTPFNTSNTSAPFGAPTQQTQNVFGISNQNSNSNQPSLFPNAIQSPASSNIFGAPAPASSSTPSMGIFGSPNIGSTPGFGTANTSIPAFEPPSVTPTPSFNFGSQPTTGVFGFSQQQQPQQQPLQQTGGVYNFGASSGSTPQVQFNMGSAPNTTGRRLRKAIRRTTQR